MDEERRPSLREIAREYYQRQQEHARHQEAERRRAARERLGQTLTEHLLSRFGVTNAEARFGGEDAETYAETTVDDIRFRCRRASPGGDIIVVAVSCCTRCGRVLAESEHLLGLETLGAWLEAHPEVPPPACENCG